MAKLRGAKKAAFLRRMAKGRAKSRRAKGGTAKRRTVSRPRARATRKKASYSGYLTRSRKRAGAIRIQLRQNPMNALLVNPSGELVPYNAAFATKQRRKATRKRRRVSPGAINYTTTRKPARRRRRSTMTVSGGRKMAKRRRRSTRRVTRRRRTIPRAVRVPRKMARRYFRGRKYKRTLYLNPSRRRRVRRNPAGFGGLLKAAFIPYATGVVVAGVSAMLDTGLSRWPVVRQLVKVAGVLAVAKFVGARHPLVAAASIGAIGASQGYPLITRLAGGMVARTPAEAVEGLAEMAESDASMGALLQGGMGALLQGIEGGPDDVGDVVGNYEEALSNMADDDDDA